MKNVYKFLFALMMFLPVIAFSQNSYFKTWDIDFSGGNNGNFSGLDASDVAVTFNAVDSKMQVEVNKVVYTWSYLNIYMGNCWTKRIVFDQANRFVEFRIKSSVALTDITVNPKGGGQDGCPKAVGKTWATAKFSVTEDEVDQWKIVLLQFGPTTGGTQNILDTMDTRLTWGLPNGSYTFDYVKIGEAAIPPTPVMEQQKAKTVQDCAAQQSVTISGIDIPNRTLDGLTIEATTEKDGIIKDVAFVDLDGAGAYIDVDAKTATLNYTPVKGMAGQSDNIIVTLKDNIRSKEATMTFAVNLLACTGGSATEEIASEVKVYPSVASSEITVDNAAGSSLSIIDLVGNVVASQNIAGDKEVVNISALAAGVYIVKVAGVTKQIVKQ